MVRTPPHHHTTTPPHHHTTTPPHHHHHTTTPAWSSDRRQVGAADSRCRRQSLNGTICVLQPKPRFIRPGCPVSARLSECVPTAASCSCSRLTAVGPDTVSCCCPFAWRLNVSWILRLGSPQTDYLSQSPSTPARFLHSPRTSLIIGIFLSPEHQLTGCLAPVGGKTPQNLRIQLLKQDVNDHVKSQRWHVSTIWCRYKLNLLTCHYMIWHI